jgi:hypothetical protein
VCAKKKVGWPLEYPAPQNIRPDAQDYGFFLEVHSLLATKLGWLDLQAFVNAAHGKKIKTVDWTTTYREALDLAHAALGLGPEHDELEGAIPNRVAVLKNWGIDRSQIVMEADMAKKKVEAKRRNGVDNAVKKSLEAKAETQARLESDLATKTGRTSGKKKNESNTPKEKALPDPLPPETLGALGLAAAFVESLADYAEQASAESKDDDDLKALADHLRQAATILAGVTA